MSLLSFVQKSFDWGGGKWFWPEEGGGTGEEFPPSEYVKKVLILRQKEAYFSTLDLSQTFEQNLYQCAHSTFPSFLGYQSRTSKHKNWRVKIILMIKLNQQLPAPQSAAWVPDPQGHPLLSHYLVPLNLVIIFFRNVRSKVKSALCVWRNVLPKQQISKMYNFFIYARTVHVCKFAVKLCHAFYNNSSRKINSLTDSHYYLVS